MAAIPNPAEGTSRENEEQAQAPLQLIPGRRSGSHVLADFNSGYKYRIDHRHERSLYLKCCDPACTARGILRGNHFRLGRTGDHNHVADIHDVHNQLLIHQCKIRAQRGAQPFSQIFEEERQRHPESDLTFQGVRATMEYARRRGLPRIPASGQEADATLQTHDRFSTTTTGEAFYRRCFSGPEGDSLVFISPTAQAVLQRFPVELFHLDGTFKVVPRPFKQFFTFHYVFDDEAYPFAYALMTRKTEAAYTEVLTFIRDETGIHPSWLVTDYESSLRRALATVFPEARRRGCWFHYSQALWRRGRRLGLVGLRSNPDSDGERLVRLCVAIALLPIRDIATGLRSVRSFASRFTDANLLNASERFLDYVEHTWVARARATNFSVFDCPIRTNNNLEAFHRKFLQIAGGYHPNFWRFLERLIEFESQVRIEQENFDRSDRSRPRQVRLQYLLDDIRITNATIKYNSGRFTVGEFLFRMMRRGPLPLRVNIRPDPMFEVAAPEQEQEEDTFSDSSGDTTYGTDPEDFPRYPAHMIGRVLGSADDQRRDEDAILARMRPNPGDDRRTLTNRRTNQPRQEANADDPENDSDFELQRPSSGRGSRSNSRRGRGPRRPPSGRGESSRAPGDRRRPGRPPGRRGRSARGRGDRRRSAEIPQEPDAVNLISSTSDSDISDIELRSRRRDQQYQVVLNRPSEQPSSPGSNIEYPEGDDETSRLTENPHGDDLSHQVPQRAEPVERIEDDDETTQPFEPVQQESLVPAANSQGPEVTGRTQETISAQLPQRAETVVISDPLDETTQPFGPVQQESLVPAANLEGPGEGPDGILAGHVLFPEESPPTSIEELRRIRVQYFEGPSSGTETQPSRPMFSGHRPESSSEQQMPGGHSNASGDSEVRRPTNLGKKERAKKRAVSQLERVLEGQPGPVVLPMENTAGSSSEAAATGGSAIGRRKRLGKRERAKVKLQRTSQPGAAPE